MNETKLKKLKATIPIYRIYLLQGNIWLSFYSLSLLFWYALTDDHKLNKTFPWRNVLRKEITAEFQSSKQFWTSFLQYFQILFHFQANSKDKRHYAMFYVNRINIYCIILTSKLEYMYLKGKFKARYSDSICEANPTCC